MKKYQETNHIRNRKIIGWKKEGLSFNDIGLKLGITGQRVKQIYDKFLKVGENKIKK